MTEYEIVKRQNRGSFPIFDVETRDIKTSRGTISRDVVLHGNAVAVLVVDRQTLKVLITTEYRSGVNEVRTAIPAGLAEENETPYDTALREVAEETGAVLSDVDIINQTTISSSEGFTSEEVTVFVILATVTKTGETHFDDDEYVTSSWVPMSHLINLVDNGVVKSAPAVVATRSWQIRSLLD